MKRLKQYLSFLPEYTILIALSITLICDLIFTQSFNYLLLIPLAAIVALLIWKNWLLAYTYSFILGLGACYMFLALISEYREFPAGSSEGKEMLLVGSLILITVGVIAVTMPLKYLRNKI